MLWTCTNNVAKHIKYYMPTTVKIPWNKVSIQQDIARLEELNDMPSYYPSLKIIEGFAVSLPRMYMSYSELEMCTRTAQEYSWWEWDASESTDKTKSASFCIVKKARNEDATRPAAHLQTFGQLCAKISPEIKLTHSTSQCHKWNSNRTHKRQAVKSIHNMLSKSWMF